MSDISALYHPVILRESKTPFHFYAHESTEKVEAYNPVCGDQFQIYLSWQNDQITEISFQGYGCAVSKAATSLLIKHLEGKTQESVENFLRRYLTAIEGQGSTGDDELDVFKIAKSFPSRLDCATLSASSLLTYIHKFQQNTNT